MGKGGGGGGGSSEREAVYDPFKRVEITSEARAKMDKMKADQMTAYGGPGRGKMVNITSEGRSKLNLMKLNQSKKYGGFWDVEEKQKVYQADKARLKATGQWGWEDQLSEWFIRGTTEFVKGVFGHVGTKALAAINPVLGMPAAIAAETAINRFFDASRDNALLNKALVKAGSPHGETLDKTNARRSDDGLENTGRAKNVLMRTTPGQTMQAQTGGATERKAKDTVKKQSPAIEKKPKLAERKAARGVLSGRQSMGSTTPLGIPPLKNRRRILMGV